MGKSLRWELTEKSNKIFHVNCFTSNRGGYFASILATMKKVRACQRIEEGEEILVRYQGGNEVWSRDERQIWLRNWNFICNCEVCSMTGDELMENEKARKKMGDLGAAMDVKSIEKVRDPFLSLDCTGVEGHVQVGKAPLASL